MIPFGLKNASTTYQRLVNMMFKEHINKMMEVYVDDIFVRAKVYDHVLHLVDIFNILRAYRILMHVPNQNDGGTIKSLRTS